MDCKPPVSDAEDGIMHHSYPSPTIDETDAQYYQAASQKTPHDMDPSEGQKDGSAPAAASRAQHGDQYELSELQQGAQPSLASHHHQSSAAELQLTAQLTQDIAQGLGPLVAEHGRPRLEELGPHDGRYGSEQARFDHDQTAKYAHGPGSGVKQGMVPLSGSSMEHDPAAADQQAHRAHIEHQIQVELQTRHGELQGGGGSQQGRCQTHTFESSASPLAESHEFSFGLPSDGLSQGQSEGLYASTESRLGRKRTKVSRACDECRRKKIRCDAPSEGGEQPCSNCRRVGAACLFSRVPQKRGPSKGSVGERIPHAGRC